MTLASLVGRRNGNAKTPPITGRISTPEDPETEFAFSTFQHTDKNGETYWIGPVDMNRLMRRALNAEPERGTHFVAIRENPTAATGSRPPQLITGQPLARIMCDTSPSIAWLWRKAPLSLRN